MKASSLIGHVLELLEDLAQTRRPADAVIAGFFKERRYLGSHDRRFIAETYYGVLRHRRLCDTILENCGNLLEGITPEGLSFFRVSAYLLVAQPSPDASLEDIHEFLGSDRDDPRLEAGLQSLSTFDREMLSNFPPGVQWSFPDWIVEAFSRDYGENVVHQLLAALNKQAPLAIRANTLKATVEHCKDRLEKEGVRASIGKLAPHGLIIEKRMNAFSLGSFRDGWFEVQDEGSQLLAALADPKPTDRVLDLCAGSGGKTLAMSAWMKNRGEITATDISARRLKELRIRMRRAGADNIRVREKFLSAEAGDPFDIVFVDAPCTGVGTIRRNPGMKWSVTEEMVSELSAKQRDILRTAVPYVRNGGLLVYATCSLFREENEDVVSSFLTDHTDFVPDERERTTGPSGRIFGGDTVRLTPHEDDSDGFFCAFLRRTAAA